jgi:hypothetical protein
VPAAGLAFNIFPNGDTKHPLRFSSIYTVRLPARDELFLETRLRTRSTVPLLETNPRHYLETSLTYQINEFIGLKLQHTYGSLPPLFQFNDHRVSTGVVLRASQPR